MKKISGASVIIKHILRNIRSNRIRSLLIVFSLMLTTAVFYANLYIEDDVVYNSERLAEGVGRGYDICVTGKIEEGEYPECNDVQYFVTEFGLFETRKVLAVGGDLSRVLSEDMITLGDAVDDFDPTAVDQAIMLRSKAMYNGLELGDTFTVSFEGRERDYILTAYASSLGILPDGDVETLEIIVNTSSLADDSGNIKYNVVLLDIAEDDIDEQCEAINRQPFGLEAVSLHGDENPYSRVDGMKKIMNIILLLVIAVAFYVVSSICSLLIDYRMPVLGTFRSIGAEAKTTSLILLAENAIYGLISGIPGIIAGEMLRLMINKTMFDTGNGHFNLFYILFSILFTVALGVIISLGAVLKSWQVPIKEQIFRRQSAAEKPAKAVWITGLLLVVASVELAVCNTDYDFFMLVAELILALLGAGICIGGLCWLFSKYSSDTVKKLFGSCSWLGVKNLGVSKISRSSSVLVAVVTAVVLVLYTGTASIASFFDKYQDNYPYDLLMKGLNMSESDLQFLSEIDGVDKVGYEYWDIKDLATLNGKVMKMAFIANDGWVNGIEAKEGLIENLEDGCAVFDKMLATKYGIDIGDEVQLQAENVVAREAKFGPNSGDIYDYDRGIFTVKAVGFCDSTIFYSARCSVVISRGDYMKYVNDTPKVVGIYTGNDTDEMSVRINDEFARRYGRFREIFKPEYLVGRDFGESVDAVKSISAVPFLVVILALFGLINNQLISFNRKRTEYAILNSTVMSKKQIAKMMTSELAASFAVGMISGVALSFWLSKIIRDIIYVTVAYVPLRISPVHFAAAFGLVFIMLLATLIFPIRELHKFDIVKEIKYE